jgi:predicted ATPase/DNA-binding SARP family transcriptional activator
MLKLALLGPPQIKRADGTAIAFRSRKELALLAYLAVEHARAHPRDTLLALLWPDAQAEAARNSLRVALANLRHALGTAGAALVADRRTVRLVPGAEVWLDVAAFRALLAACKAHRHEKRQDCLDCAARLDRAMDLYGGDFLAGFSLADAIPFEEWALVCRAELHHQALDTLTTLAATHEAAGDYGALCRCARHQLALEPWHEPAHRTLMRGLALLGDRASALAHYEVCRTLLADELGVEPDSATTTLAEQIRTNELSIEHVELRTASIDQAQFSILNSQLSIAQHNLPADLTPFVGRESELAEIAARLHEPDVRLLTLIGAGGMGKTRLALEVARTRLANTRIGQGDGEAVGQAFPDGVCFVSLAPLSDSTAIVPAVAAAIGLRLQGGDPKQALLHALRDKRLLLILDNFEHLLGPSSGEDGAELVVEMLQHAACLQLIVTSRERLNVRGEQLYVVEGMELAAANPAVSSAVRLFVQSARRTLPGFKLSDANLPHVLRICQLVRGMPLGIELAAARVEMLPLAMIASEIARSADFLAFDWRDAPERQRSMRAVFDWSWRLLNEVERQVLRQLAIFRGGFTREAAENVAGATLGVLTSLVHKSLLRRTSGDATNTGRYELHELLRQFADDSLDTAPGERAAAEARHGPFYLEFVATRERRLARNEPREAADEIQVEIDNIRQAWLWAAGHAQVAALGRSAFGLAQFYWLAGPFSEWVQTFRLAAERVQAHLGCTPPGETTRLAQRVLSELWGLIGSALIFEGQHEQALAIAERAIELGQASAGVAGEARGFLVKGQALRRLGQSSQAHVLLEHAADMARRYRRAGAFPESLPTIECLAYNWLCSIALTGDDYGAAKSYIYRGLRICQALDNKLLEIHFLIDLADFARTIGDYPAARRQYEAALHLAGAVGYHRGEAVTQLQLGDLAYLRGDYGPAYELIARALKGFRAIGDLIGEAAAIRDTGHLELLVGNYTGARKWFDRWIEAMGSVEMSVHDLFLGALHLALLAHLIGDQEQALSYAKQGCQMAQQLQGHMSQATALVVLGSVQVGLNRLEDATAGFAQALAFYTELGQAHAAVDARAGLAQVALAQDQPELALTQVEAVLAVLADRPLGDLSEPFSAYLTCYRVLKANGDPRAAAVLQTAQRLLYEYADTITDDALRKSFLENVVVHRELLGADTLLIASDLHMPPREARQRQGGGRELDIQ